MFPMNPDDQCCRILSVEEAKRLVDLQMQSSKSLREEYSLTNLHGQLLAFNGLDYRSALTPSYIFPHPFSQGCYEGYGEEKNKKPWEEQLEKILFSSDTTLKMVHDDIEKQVKDAYENGFADGVLHVLKIILKEGTNAK